jgi:positive regulator of sigma E activity
LFKRIEIQLGIVRKVFDKEVIVSPLFKPDKEIRVLNTGPVKTGDVVKYVIIPHKYAFYYFTINIVPFLDFILFYVLSFLIVKNYFFKYIDYIRIINFVSGVIGFSISKLLAYYYDAKTDVFDDFKPIIIAVLKKEKKDNKKTTVEELVKEELERVKDELLKIKEILKQNEDSSDNKKDD